MPHSNFPCSGVMSWGMQANIGTGKEDTQMILLAVSRSNRIGQLQMSSLGIGVIGRRILPR
jgi:hypothetical protein